MRLRRTAVLLALVMFAAGCGRDRSGPPNRPPAAAVSAEGRTRAVTAEASSANGDWFTDRSAETGLDFLHFNGMSGKFYQPEIMGPGVALFDYDNDGDLDVFVVQGATLGSGAPLLPLPDKPGGRLFRNDLKIEPDGTRGLHFTDVTEESGLRTTGYGMGTAVADFDNDGWLDLYVTGFGRSQLFHNNRNGTFTDVSDQSGTANAGAWAVSAAFVDIDRDGWLDLFVGDYLDYTLPTHVPCFSVPGVPDYCRPEVYRAQPSRLYRNLGNGRFADIMIRAGLGRAFGPSLGVSAADLNGDGWPDLFVANDEQDNQLWINQHDGTFKDDALPAGVAVGAYGERKANMGVDAGDFDNDGDDDLVVTELINQGTSLFVNNGSGSFEEQSVRLGVRRPSLPFTGFGSAWFDYDNDGWLDILQVNGEVNENLTSPADARDPFPLAQRKLLLRNVGGRFEDVTGRAGRALEVAEVGRGAAFGDIDNDGDTDVVIANDAGHLRLLINNVGTRSHWIGLRLAGTAPTASNQMHAPGGAIRDQVGARVAVIRSTGPTLWRRARTDGSYASSNDPRVLVGLGQSREKPRVRVTWPDGRSQEWADVPIDRYTTLTEGDGR